MTQVEADSRRCCTCQRWNGPRRVGEEAGTVRFADEAVTGQCVDGPWDGSIRNLRNACGRWHQWLALLPGVTRPGEHA
ncbi:MAG: hypothetical protein KDH20_18160 [Rhodocyclaceae bacterium]|nr:hypothetical protein [Rhodocyclaceae bacterium]